MIESRRERMEEESGYARIIRIEEKTGKKNNDREFDLGRRIKC